MNEFAKAKKFFKIVIPFLFIYDLVLIFADFYLGITSFKLIIHAILCLTEFFLVKNEKKVAWIIGIYIAITLIISSDIILFILGIFTLINSVIYKNKELNDI